MIFKDYYKILGLSTNKVSMQEIKNAYKEQAKKYHPDLNGGNQKFEERFKDINESYKVLSDATLKRKYDRVWYNNVGRKIKVGRSAPNSGKEAIIGMFFGNVSREQNKKIVESSVKGENIVTKINVSLEDAYYGLTKTLGFKTTSGKMKCYKIDIPAGVQNNEKLRLVGQGKKSVTGGKNGDLLVEVNIQDTEEFKLDGRNIKTVLKLTPWEAALEKKIKFNTFDGEVTIFMPDEIQGGEEIVLSGKGYPDKIGVRGDLILKVQIVIPKNITDEQKDYFKKMKEVMDYNPRNK